MRITKKTPTKMQTVKENRYLVIIMNRDMENKKWIATYEDKDLKIEVKGRDGDIAARACANVVQETIERIEKGELY